jgi:hypothetical protein
VDRSARVAGDRRPDLGPRDDLELGHWRAADVDACHNRVLKFVPVITTTHPAGPLVGENDEMVGGVANAGV